MSIVFMISKKKTNTRVVARNRIAMRIRAAFELIGVWGADAEPREHVQVCHQKKYCVSSDENQYWAYFMGVRGVLSQLTQIILCPYRQA